MRYCRNWKLKCESELISKNWSMLWRSGHRGFKPASSIPIWYDTVPIYQWLHHLAVMSAASPNTIHHYHKTPRSSTMLVCHLWQKLVILAATNAPAVRSRKSLKVANGNTSANALSPQGWSRAEMNWTDLEVNCLCFHRRLKTHLFTAAFTDK